MRAFEKRNCTLLRKQTSRQTDTKTQRHADFMTESAQLDRLSENVVNIYIYIYKKKYAQLI